MSTTWRDRLKQALDESEMTAAEALRQAGLNPTAWRDIMKRRSTPNVDALAALCRVFGKTLDEIYLGHDSERLQLSICGAYTGGDMWDTLDEGSVRSVPLRLLSNDYISISIDSNDYDPEYRRNDVLCGPKISGHYLDNHIGRDCIIETSTGQRVIKTLHRGTKPGRYTLRSLRRDIPDIVDARINWAAPITMILRGVS